MIFNYGATVKKIYIEILAQTFFDHILQVKRLSFSLYTNAAVLQSTTNRAVNYGEWGAEKERQAKKGSGWETKGSENPAATSNQRQKKPFKKIVKNFFWG